MGEAYPELSKAQSHIEKVLRQEEEQFSADTSSRLKIFEQVVSELKGELFLAKSFSNCMILMVFLLI